MSNITVNSLGEYANTVNILTAGGNVKAQTAVDLINKYNLSPAQFDEFILGTEAVEPWYTSFDKAVGYRVVDRVPVNPLSGSAASGLNSNVGATTQELVKVPIETALDQAGNVKVSTGLTKFGTAAKSGLNFISKEILPAIGAAGLGIRAGVAWDRFMYSWAPDFWDSIGLSTLNPDTWGTITCDYPDGFLKSAFNGLLGINPNSGETQMYLDEQAAAYLAQYMYEAGFFNTASVPGIHAEEYHSTSGGQLTNPNIIPIIARTGTRISVPSTFGNTFWMATSGNVAFYGYYDNNNRIEYQALSTSPFLYKSDYNNPSLQPQYNAVQGSVDGHSFWYTTFSATMVDDGYTNQKIYYNDELARARDACRALFFNSDAKPLGGDLPEGVSHQEGATIPDFSNCTTAQDFIDALRNQYPDMYNDAVEQHYVDHETGQDKKIVYIPLGTPSSYVENEETGQPEGTKPVIDPDNPGQSQDNPTFDPAAVDHATPDIDTLLNLLIELITDIIPSGYEDPEPSPDPNPDEKPDTTDPNNPPNPEGTGSGETPAVVTPTGNASALWSVYNPSQSEINSFGAWLWSSNFIDQVLKLFNNPMQSIIGIHKIFAQPTVSGTGHIVVGYLDSGVSANLVSAQYVDVDCGTVQLYEQFGNVFDYTDTHARLYLPFIGIVPLDTADVMRGIITVIYHVDVITGACLAEVQINRDGAGGTIYQFAGDAAVRYPISSGSYMGIIAGIASAVGGIASAALTGGATLPMAAGAVAGGLAGAKTQVQHSGSFAGNAGAMGCKIPYLIIERPQTMIAQGYNYYEGTGVNQVMSVGDMAGYFKMANVKTAAVSGATEEELNEIKSVLESGAIK